MDNSFDYDEIGFWSEIKLEIVKKYAAAYTTAIRTSPFIKKCIYIDAFAGSGVNISRESGKLVKGSPLNALSITPGFNEFHLIDRDGGKTNELQKLIGSRKDVFIYTADANEVLLDEVFPRCKYDDYHRALCLLDPYTLNVDWKVIAKAGQMRSIEIFYNFMIMDVNRNVLRHDRRQVAADQEERMDRAWGDHTWVNFAYQPRQNLFGESVDFKTNNESLAEAFRQRLQTIAGFLFAPKPIAMRNTKGATIYYLFFASSNPLGAKIAEDVLKIYR